MITMQGDSMSPWYYNGDWLFVRSQPGVNRGEYGLFLHQGKFYVKEQGRDILVARNPKYRPLHTDETTRCFGKVVGLYVTDPAILEAEAYRVARDSKLRHGGGEITDPEIKRNLLRQNEINKHREQINDFANSTKKRK